MLYLLLTLAVAGLVWWFLVRRTPPVVAPLPPDYVRLLTEYVPYYTSLPDGRRADFAGQVSRFLTDVRIEGVGTPVDDLDRVLVASSAVIPILAFGGWQYPNLTTVLLYPTAVNEAYEPSGATGTILGQVGEGGALQSTMVLTKPALRAGFSRKDSPQNTGIHEFVHLLDKVDGSIDGAPESMIPKPYLQPWLRLIHKQMHEIKSGQSDIDPYALTSEAEFFAVASEYFFKRPDLLKTRHPALFAALQRVFRQNPPPPARRVGSGR